VGIELSSKFWRVLAIIDFRNLRSRKADDIVSFVISEIDIEIVEITPGGTHYNDTFYHHVPPHQAFEMLSSMTTITSITFS